MKSQGFVQSNLTNEQNIKKISHQKYSDAQKLNKAKLVSTYTVHDGNVQQNMIDQ